MKFTAAVLIMLSLSLNALAQQPRVANLSEHTGAATQKIEISGSGFNATPGNNKVWFRGAFGNVISSTENILEVEIPAGAGAGSVTVTNLTTGLTGFSSENFHLIYPGDPSATINGGSTVDFPVNKQIFDIVIADLDGDGKNDMAVSENDPTGTEVLLYRNDGTNNAISFVPSSIAINKPTIGITSGDLDGDGKVDLVLTRGGTTRNQIYALLNTSTVGNISFALAKSFFMSAGQNAQTVKVRDLDLDGKAEVIVTNTSNNLLSIFKNTSVPGTITLSFNAIEIPVADAPSSNGLVVDDFNDDGKPDIAVTTFLDSDIFIIPNLSLNGTLEFGDVITIPVSGNLNNLSAGDVNEDGKIDLVVAKPIQNEVSILLNQSDDNISFSAPTSFASGSGSWGATLVDYAGNGKLDLMVTSPSGTNFTYFKNTSTGGTLSLEKTDIPQTNRSRNATAADLSGDGKPDVAITTQNTGGTAFSVIVLKNDICTDCVLLTETSVQICAGQSHTIEVAPNPGTNYVWTRNGTEVQNGPSAEYTTTSGGNYVITAESEGACSIISQTVTITLTSGTVPIDPVASNNGPTCAGTDVTLSSTDVTGATFEWTGPNDFTSTDQNPVIPNISPDQAGFYYVTAKISPCESNVSRTLVEVITPPDFTIIPSGDTRFCQGESVTLSVASVAGYSYQWTLDGTDITGATSSSYSITSNGGAYQAKISGVTSNCDLLSNIEQIDVFPPPTPSFTTSGSTCANSQVVFENTTTTESDQTPTYLWNFGDASATSNLENPTHIYATAGDYNVTLTMGYVGRSCNKPTTQVVTIDEPTAFDFLITGDVPFCTSDSVKVEIPGNYVTYQWSTGANTSFIYAREAGTYTATAINSSGCGFTNEITLSTSPGPEIIITSEREAILPGQSVDLTASGADEYVWSPAESLSTTTEATTIASPVATTVYEVIGTSFTSGCKGSNEITITVQDTGDELPVNALSMFSPNIDGTDDTWAIENMDLFPECTVRIFTRSGETVYEESPYVEWDGTGLNGSNVAEGAYYYVISCDDGKSKSGSVSIIR